MANERLAFANWDFFLGACLVGPQLFIVNYSGEFKEKENVWPTKESSPMHADLLVIWIYPHTHMNEMVLLTSDGPLVMLF